MLGRAIKTKTLTQGVVFRVRGFKKLNVRKMVGNYEDDYLQPEKER